ncbi:MAG: hypothetical protein ACQESR_12000 [Planctomycetota bacterium]
MESCPTQAVLPLVGLAAENVIRDRHKTPETDPVGFPVIQDVLDARTQFCHRR